MAAQFEISDVAHPRIKEFVNKKSNIYLKEVSRRHSEWHTKYKDTQVSHGQLSYEEICHTV